MIWIYESVAWQNSRAVIQMLMCIYFQVALVVIHNISYIVWHFVVHCRYECLQADISLHKCGVLMMNVTWTSMSSRLVKMSLSLKVFVATMMELLQTISHREDYQVPRIRRNRSSSLYILCKRFCHFITVIIKICRPQWLDVEVERGHQQRLFDCSDLLTLTADSGRNWSPYVSQTWKASKV